MFNGSIFSNDDLVLTGNGSLTVTGNYRHAICSDDVIYMESGTVHIASAVKDGFHAKDDGLTTLGNMEINGGTVEILSCEEGLEAKNACVIHAGTIEITAAIMDVTVKK